MALSTRIAVMDRGQVVQIGTPAEVYEFPKTRFVADFIGTTNLFEGIVVTAEPGTIIIRAPALGCDLVVEDLARFRPGQPVWVALRPEKIRLAKTPAAGPRLNQLRGEVWELGYLGNHSTYRIKLASGTLVTATAQNDRRTADWSIDWGDEIYLSWSADAAILLES